MEQLHTCQYCGKLSEETFYGFISMSLPIPEMEIRKSKWGEKWWENLEREDLTKEEIKDLDGISMYDQLLSTVSRGRACIPCLKLEDELLNKYYPQI